MHRLVSFFARLGEFIRPLAEHFGAPGLVAVAFLDSSFLSLPEVCDLLVVTLTLHEPGLWWYYAVATAIGSVAGCFALYTLGRKGGEAFIRRRLHARHVDWGLGLFRRYGLLAIVVPSLLPPPMPFKLFVLVAGIADVRPRTFLAAVAIGRGFRYGAEAWLARAYGDRAIDVIRENLPTVSIGLAAVLLIFGLAIMFWQRRAA